MNSKTMVRTVIVLAALVAASAATTASAQVVSADLGVSFNSPISGTPATPASINFTNVTSKAYYYVQVANAGPAYVPAGAVVTFTPPAGAKASKSSTSIIGVKATCSQASDGVSISCTLGLLAPTGVSDAKTGYSVLKVGVSAVAPSTLDTCPAGPLGAATASVTAAGITDTNPANDTATSGTTKSNPYVILTPTFEGAPPQTTVGSTITYSGSVTNDGPCEATGVIVETDVSKTLAWQSGTGVSSGNACSCGWNYDCADNQTPCTIDALAPGQTVTFAQSYKVVGNIDGIISSGTPASLTVGGDQYDVDNGTAGATTDSQTTLLQTPSSCSSAGGSMGLLSLVAFGLLAIRRRRSA